MGEMLFYPLEIQREEKEKSRKDAVSGRFGNIVGVSGEGRQKIAYKLESGKLMLILKEKFEPKENEAEYYKSVYYLHKILHILLPDNFLDVRMASKSNAIVVDEVPDTPDFIKAKEIRSRSLTSGQWTREEIEWMMLKRKELYESERFRKIRDLFDEVVVKNDDCDPEELAGPTNCVMVGDNPVVLDLLSPHDGYKPIIKEKEFFVLITRMLKSGELSGFQENLLKKFYGRYKANVEASILGSKGSTKS